MEPASGFAYIPPPPLMFVSFLTSPGGYKYSYHFHPETDNNNIYLSRSHALTAANDQVRTPTSSPNVIFIVTFLFFSYFTTDHGFEFDST